MEWERYKGKRNSLSEFGLKNPLLFLMKGTINSLQKVLTQMHIANCAYIDEN